jgi:ABC-type multidrug transport system ATPase subunit
LYPPGVEETVSPDGGPHPAQPGEAVITVQRADLGYGETAVLRGVDVVVRNGSHVVIIGDNGSGKSTLIQTLGGLLPKLGGEIEVLGSDPLGERRRLHARIGHLGHRDPFYPELTGRENLTFHASLHGHGAALVHEALTAVGLDADSDRAVHHYSHGMRRRLGLAKALIGDPGLVLLDEPESGLDAKGRAAFRDLLGRTRDRTVVLSTHHWTDWLDWSDQALVVGAGRVIQVALEGDLGQRRTRIENMLDTVGGAHA